MERLEKIIIWCAGALVGVLLLALAGLVAV